MATLQQITANDIASWDSLSDVASTLEKRGLKIRENLGEANELVLQLTDREFIVLVEAGPGESASDFKPDDRRRRTNLVATNDYEEFTFLTRIRALDGQQHGRIKHQKLSFTKEQMTSEGGEKNTILQKLNSLEYGSAASIYDDLYDTKKVVKEFYQQFETLRTDLVQEVAGIPDDRGDAKQRYVQVTLDRMIFLYFIQEKRLLDRDPNYLHDHHNKCADEDKSVYEEFYEPLFFDFLAENKKSTEFGALPYLNGGLFSKNPIEEEFEEACLGDTTERTNELFGAILDFLSNWNWNVDERLDIVDPKNLSPAILGHIFEQTVNQKEMGAYYTPEEITGFMSRRTVHPYLLDHLNEEVGAEYEDIDDVFGFPAPNAESGAEAIADGGAVTAQVPTENIETRHVETLYHDFLKEARVLDPAVGSGAFLLAAQEVLLDIYMQCIDFFQQMDEEGKTWELEERTVEELETIEEGRGSASLYAKRSIVLNNLYGVDIDDGAVEICKLRLWLSMVADIEDEPSEVEPLPNIDFNIRQGNSLIGYLDNIKPSSDGETTMSDWSLYEKYEEIIDAVHKHREATTSSDAKNWREIANSRMAQYRPKFDDQLLSEFQNSGWESANMSDISEFSPFHWPLEFPDIWAEGRFDVIIGNPPWDEITPSRDDFFPKYDEVFRQRLPDDKNQKQEELLESDQIKQEWENYEARMKRLADFFNSSSDYNLQRPKVDGRVVPNTNDLSALFLERVFDLVAEDGHVSQILPGNLFTGASTKDLRVHLLEKTNLDVLAIFENHSIFEDIHPQYKFGIIKFANSSSTTEVRTKFEIGSVDILRDVDSELIEVNGQVLKKYSPEARTIPYIHSEQYVDILRKIISHPSIGEDVGSKWRMQPYLELKNAYDLDTTVETESEGEYPVFGGRNIYQFIPHPRHMDGLDGVRLWSVESDDPDVSSRRRIQKKNTKVLKRALYDAFDGTGSQKGFVNDLLENHRGEPLSMDDVLLDCNTYRIGYRDIARSTDERTMIATVLPKGVVCTEKLRVIRPYEISPSKADLSEYPLHNVYHREFTDKELFVAVGLLNSIPFDFLMRTKVDVSVVMYKFLESQVPRLTEGDDWFHYISDRAAKLNCLGEEFEEMRTRLGGVTPATKEDERERLQAEIDAATFHAYGFDRRETEFILDDFDRVSTPRRMTDEYFDMVFEKFDRLDTEGPFE